MDQAAGHGFACGTLGFIRRVNEEPGMVGAPILTCVRALQALSEGVQLVGYHRTPWSKHEDQKVLRLVVCHLWSALRVEE